MVDLPPMQDRTAQRLSNIDARFGEMIRRREAEHTSEPAAFHLAFDKARRDVIVPVFEELARALEERGHRGLVELSEAPSASATLRLFLRSSRPLGHRIVFEVIDRGLGLQVLAFLEASPPVTDIARYRPEDLSRDVVEQVAMDALEHIFAYAAQI
jgi:hypothetical protein